MVGQSATIKTKCPVANINIDLKISEDGPIPGTSGYIHFAVPAKEWWVDIGFT